MNIEKAIQILSEEEELTTKKLTHKEDLKFIRNAKVLNILDKITKKDSLQKIIDDLNYVRKSEGLPSLHKPS